MRPCPLDQPQPCLPYFLSYGFRPHIEQAASSLRPRDSATWSNRSLFRTQVLPYDHLGTRRPCWLRCQPTALHDALDSRLDARSEGRADLPWQSRLIPLLNSRRSLPRIHPLTHATNRSRDHRSHNRCIHAHFLVFNLDQQPLGFRRSWHRRCPSHGIPLSMAVR